MRIANPCDWIIERLRTGKPFFSVRYNDGEMIMMYRTQPEGTKQGNNVNVAPTNYQLGDDLRGMLQEIADRDSYDDVMIGHCFHDDPLHALNVRFWSQYYRVIDREAEAGGHWPLDGVVDGSTIRLLEEIGQRPSFGRGVLIAPRTTENAHRCCNADLLFAPSNDSWSYRNLIKSSCEYMLNIYPNCVFIWAGGIGLKPTAWELFRRFPQSSHIDVGHLFDGCFGVLEYGWMKEKLPPWYEPYFNDFAPRVLKHVSK